MTDDTIANALNLSQNLSGQCHLNRNKCDKKQLNKSPRDLIVFGEDWGGQPSSTQQLIKHLACNRKVVWVNSIGLRQPQFCKQDIKRLWQKISATITSTMNNKQQQTINDNDNDNDNDNHNHYDNNFVVVNPTTMPAPRSAITRYITAKLLAYQVRQVLNTLRLHQPVLWISLPTAVDIVGKLGESAVVYYCCDDFNSLEGVDHHTVSQREQQLANCADLILATSDLLHAKFSNKPVVTVEHGVDFKLFSQPSQRASDLPTNNNPTAGYYGSIASWLDLELLQQTIAQLPNWNFVFIGKITVDVSVLRQYSNVYFIDNKPHHLLPSYSQHWTASLLPFKINGQILACNPFKLREYLAAGRPIISTNFPALLSYQPLIDVVNNSQQMVAALQRARCHDQIDPRKRQAVINHTWQDRANQVAKLVDNL